MAQANDANDPSAVIHREFLQFLEYFAEPSEPGNEPEDEQVDEVLPYIQRMKWMKQNTVHTMTVEWPHLSTYNHHLATLIASEFFRFETSLQRAVKDLAKKHVPEWFYDDEADKAFYVSFRSMPEVLRLRQLKPEKISTLTSFSGTVTRTSEVRPELVVGTFECKQCGESVSDIEQQSQYTPPAICPNAQCNNKLDWRLLKDHCKFVDWQRVRVQEISNEVPAGSLPRTMDVILRAEQVEQSRAGDSCTFTGSLQVIPEAPPKIVAGKRVQQFSERTKSSGATGSEGIGGLRSLGARELHHRLVFLANNVESATKASGEHNNIREEEGDEEEFTNKEMEEIRQMQDDPNIFSKLVQSVAPAVHGYSDIKRAVLLMLLGGVHKTTTEGIKLRGDINVAIIGDPSCAKSQFLKYVSSFLPRAVYTSGKSSSAAGLTATVVKDSETGEHSIEAGALMLADNGICCIDEFDKMDPQDQVAIHEAMEQQTISISKAGINASLNARTSILAAANPLNGRYDKSKPLRLNVNLPAPVLSRFDLILMMLDEPDEEVDYNIAWHIVNLHALRDEAVDPPYKTVQLQRYIKSARQIKPCFTDMAQEDMVAAYTELRSNDAMPGSQSAYRITVRQLEALVRLSEAVARVHRSNLVLPSHVREAKRLLRSSIISVDHKDISVDLDEAEEEDVKEKDFEAIVAQREKEQQDRGDGVTGSDQGERTEVHTEAPAGAAHNGEERRSSKGDGEADDEEDEEQKEDKRKKRSKFEISYEDFQRTKTLLVQRLREEGEGDGESGSGSLKESDLLNWFVMHQVDKGLITGANQMKSKYKEAMAVTRKLIKEGVLVVTQELPPAQESTEEGSRTAEHRMQRYLAVHHNYSPD